MKANPLLGLAALLALAALTSLPLAAAAAAPGDVVPAPLDEPSDNDKDWEVGEQMC